MIRNFLYLALMVSVTLTPLAGCGEKETESEFAPSPRKAAPPPVKQGASVPPPESAPELIPPKYVYEPSGRRDPFETLLNIKRPVLSVDVQMTPLQKIDVGQLRLIGVILGKGEPRAMVIAPDGKSYILKNGVKVGKNDGTVVDVTQDAVLVEERYVDFSGEVRTATQYISLPKREGVE